MLDLMLLSMLAFYPGGVGFWHDLNPHYAGAPTCGPRLPVITLLPWLEVPPVKKINGAPVIPPPAQDPDKEESQSGRKPVARGASLRVEVLADARLYINNQLMKATGPHRHFDTPPLEPGRTYRYTLRAEVIRDGRHYQVEQTVVFQRGDVVQVSLREELALAIQQRGRLVVQLPEGSRLYINGRLMAGFGPELSFATPPLEPGQTYYYDLKAEIVRAGQAVIINRTVVVRSGQITRTTFIDSQPVSTGMAGR